MSLTLYWQLDVAADAHRGERSRRTGTVARDVRTPSINRFDHYAQIARAAVLTGYDGLFLPHRAQADDTRIVAAAIARATPRLLLVPEFPGWAGSAVYAAKQAASFQRYTHGRLGWAIAPDADADERARHGDGVADTDLAARTEEFLKVARGVQQQRPFTFQGRFFEVVDGGFAAPLDRVSAPPLYLRGEDDAALALSAAQADVHLFAPDRYDGLRERIGKLAAFAAEAGRVVAPGLVQPVITRETDDEAAEAARGDGSAIVGSYDLVATRLAETAALGIAHIVLTATPSLEEAYRIGEFVLPRLRARLASQRAAA